MYENKDGGPSEREREMELLRRTGKVCHGCTVEEDLPKVLEKGQSCRTLIKIDY